jgi:hypothetical protein
MRLVGQVHITVRGDVIHRDPSLWERLKRGMGGDVDLDTGERQNQLEATAVVDGVRRALGRLGVDNALSLVIDDTVIFQDADGKAGDLPDLVIALADHSSVFGKAFKELRFAAEHDEAGLHLIVETRARTRHLKNEPAAVVSVGGRIRALEPMRGETAEAYRARVEPLTKDAALFEAARHAFESFVTRLRQALSAAMPDADVAERRAEARLVKPGSRELTAPAPAPLAPMHPGYDPFLVYYPSPMGMMLDAMIFSSFVHMMMPPPLVVVSPLGMPLGSTANVGATGDPDKADADATAHGHDGSDDHGGGDDHGGHDQGDGDHGGDGDLGDSGHGELASAWGDDFGGGDFGDGGDFGGGDFGGGDW